MLPASFYAKSINEWDSEEPYVSPRAILLANIARVTADYNAAGLYAPPMKDQYQCWDAHVALTSILAERKYA